MGPFGQRASQKWHKGIDAAALAKFPVDSMGTQNETFPWTLLKSYTEVYLSKKAKISQEDREARLVSLIQKHEVKSTAIAAAGHAIPAWSLRALLTPEVDYFDHIDQDDFERFSYCQAISAAKEVNGAAITNIEAHAARILLQSSSSGLGSEPDSRLETLLQLLLTEEMSTSMLLYRPIVRMTCSAFEAFVQRLETMKWDGEWQRAYETTRWLVPLSKRLGEANPPNLDLENTISSSFPDWKIWAAWQPNVNRLLLWTYFAAETRSKLRHVLALEGPDFVAATRATLANGIASQGSESKFSSFDFGQLSIQAKTGSAGNIWEILFRLLRVIDDTSQRAQQNVDLLIYFCGEKSIDHDSVTLLECVNAMWSPAVASAVLQLLSKECFPGCMAVDEVIRVLPLLSNAPGHGLRSLLAPNLAARVSCCIEEMQSDLDIRLREGSPWAGVALKLLAFGDALRESEWLLGLLDTDTRILFASWPSTQEIMSVQELHKSTLGHNMAGLLSLVEEYCRSRLLKYAKMPGTPLIEGLLAFWGRILDDRLRLAALLLLEVSESLPHGNELFFTLLAEIPALPTDLCTSFQQILQRYLSQAGSTATMACIDMTRLLISVHLESLNNWRRCNLRRLLRLMLEQQKETLIEQTLTELSGGAWLQWIEDICEIFGGISKIHSMKLPIQDYLFHWTKQLAEFSTTITWIEENLACKSVLRCFLLGGGEEDDTIAMWLLGILSCFQKAGAGRYQPIFQQTLAFLRSDAMNSKEVCETLRWMSDMSHAGEAACERVLDLAQHTSKQVAEAVLAGWLNSLELTNVDGYALKGLSRVLGFGFDAENLLPAQTLDAAMAYFDEQIVELLEEARRLDRLRMSVIAEDPDGAAALLEFLGIESPSPVDDAMVALPAALVDVVEKISEHEVELHFPITHLNWLQRSAIGVGDANSLLVRLILGDSSLPPGFCIHVDNELESNQHSPWMMFDGCSVPNSRFCGIRISRCSYQLSRALFRHLQGGFVSLEATHSFFYDAIKNVAQSCTMCGIPSYTKLHRSTVCTNTACTEEYGRSDLDFQLGDLFQDAAVVDMQLTMLYSAAATNNPALLPDYPGNEIANITTVLDKISPVTELRKNGLLETSSALEDQFKTLLLWICGNSRRFLVSVPEQLRVPSLPGSLQFLLASAQPNREAAFTEHRNGRQSTVLFHGTTMDRLYSILHQGLRSFSGTVLQANGAALGSGIYMAEEPRTAWAFLNKAGVAGRKTWKKSPFGDFKVLLGCEYLGTKPAVNPGVHVIDDPTTVMVRYIFLIPPNAIAPLAAHLTPAMLSCFAQLR